MRAGTTEEISANFLVRPYKVRICDTHSFRTHHLLHEWMQDVGCHVSGQNLRRRQRNEPQAACAELRLVDPCLQSVGRRSLCSSSRPRPSKEFSRRPNKEKTILSHRPLSLRRAWRDATSFRSTHSLPRRGRRVSTQGETVKSGRLRQCILGKQR